MKLSLMPRSLAARTALVLLLGLGTWQVQRRSWKMDLIEQRAAALQASPAGCGLQDGCAAPVRAVMPWCWPFCLPLEWASLTDMAGGYWPGLLAGAVQPVGLAFLQGEVDCSTLAAACCCLPDQLRQQRMHSSGTRCLCALPPAP